MSANATPEALAKVKTVHVSYLNTLRSGCGTTPLTMDSFEALMKEDSDSSSKNMWMWLGPLIGILAVLIIAGMFWMKKKGKSVVRKTRTTSARRTVRKI